MATTFWIGNQALVQGVTQVQVTAVATGGVLTATLNTNVVSYTVLAADTLATAVLEWLALLSSSLAPPEYQEEAFALKAGTTDIITATGKASSPFFGMTGGLVFTASGGCTVTQTTVKAFTSPSDIGDPLNWLRSGLNTLPVAGDDLLLANSSVPLLWNLTALRNIRLGSMTRRQDFTATVGLPENNPNGYYEYRPTYLQLLGPAGGPLPVVLGGGPGGGPSRERYDFQGQQYTLAVLGSGSAADLVAIRILGNSSQSSSSGSSLSPGGGTGGSTLSVVGTSVGVALLPGETAGFASAQVDGGGSLSVGPGCTISGTVTVNGGTATLAAAPAGGLTALNGSQVTVNQDGLLWSSVVAANGCTLSWLAGGTISSLNLTASSTLDKSGDWRPLTVVGGSLDGATCRINDPLNTITYTNAMTVTGQVSGGPFVFTGSRTVKVT